MLKKYISFLAVLLIMAVVFAGCGTSGRSEVATSSSAPAMDSAQQAAFANKGDYKQNLEEAQEDSFEAQKQDIRKVIKSGEIAVEVEDVDSAYSSVLQIINDLDGEEFSKNYYYSGEHKRMELVIKLPPENLNEFQKRLTDLVGNGKIKRSNIRSQDITSDYYDTKARLESYEASRDQLRELLKKAETVEDILKIHNELTRLQAEIDALQGRVKMWDKLVSMATITLYIDKEDDPLKHTKTVSWKFNSPEEIWRTMRNSFISVVNTLYSLIVWLVIITVSALPILVPAGIIVWVVLRRRHNKKDKDKTSPPLA